MKINDSVVDRHTYAVVGDPIDHSLSPAIHQLFAEQCGVALRYERWHLSAENFEQSVVAFFENGGGGLNITAPHKLRAFQLCSIVANRASLSEAANTLFLCQDGIAGDNTDGKGLLSDIDRLGWPVAGQRILLVGAGGAVRGVLSSLLEADPQQVVIVNRTAEKASQLAEMFIANKQVENDAPIIAAGLDYSDAPFDLVINGTSAAYGNAAPDIDKRLLSGANCYDMMYGKELTPFLSAARDGGARALADGLGMLVGQAAESFFIWLNKTPDIAPVIAQIRERICQTGE